MTILRVLSVCFFGAILAGGARAQSAGSRGGQFPLPDAGGAVPDSRTVVPGIVVPKPGPALRTFHSGLDLNLKVPGPTLRTQLAQGGTYKPRKSCYTMRTYAFTDGDLQSDAPRASGYSTCVVASATQLKIMAPK